MLNAGDEVMHTSYAMHMRTTISLDDRLAQQVRRRAARRGLSVSAFIAATLDDAIKRPVPSPAKPFRLITVGGGGPLAGVDLDRPRTLEIADDEDRWVGRS